jgi:hypothetical protein
MNETTTRIGLPGTGAFAHFSTVLAVRELHRHRQEQEVIAVARVQRELPTFRSEVSTNMVKDSG